MAAAPAPPQTPAPPAAAREIRVYAHSGLLYWWPVWLVGLVMAAWTLVENRHVALVPPGAVVAGNTVTVPDGSAPILTPVHLSASRTPGMVFALTVLAVIAFGSGWMRGWRAYTFAFGTAAVLLLINWMAWWDELARWAAYLQVHINLGGYLLLSGGLLLLWLAQVFVVDRRKYIVFTESQILVHHEVGEQDQAYDTGGIAFEKAPYDWFRWVVGCGAGDLRARVGGQWIEIPNVIRVGARLGAIERMLRTKDVD